LEAAAAALVERGVRTMSARLAALVYGHVDHGFVPRLIQVRAQENIGNGLNRWPAVHRLDVAC
jgi:hypothetical protein